MMDEASAIRDEIWRLKRKLAQKELDDRGNIDFLWGGVVTTAEAVERPHARMSIEHFWRARVAGHSIDFRRTDQGKGVGEAWDAHVSACGAYYGKHGTSPQDAADQLHAMISGFHSETSELLGVLR